ncbi:MAG: uracil-DNA glycosylase [Variibacter sp.]
MPPIDPANARDVLTFYAEAGVTALVGETPVDRLAAGVADPVMPPALLRQDGPRTGDRGPARETEIPARTLRPRGAPAAAPAVLQSGPAPLAPEAAALAARDAAAQAGTLEELRTILETFDGCALKRTAKRLVFADGNPQARLMFVGEAPGREEDLEGLPFVGPSGQLLNRMLAAIGLDRTSVYIANIIPWRPPGNRDPSLQETQTCLPFIRRQIELVAPDVLVTLGKPSTAALLGVADGIRRTRGRWMTYQAGARDIRAMATYHPAYLLRTPLEKRLSWRDFLAIKKALEP